MIVVFGGSFDPVHNGHIAMADAVQKEKHPDKILWIPSHHAPHKPETPPSKAAHRVAYLHAVVDERPHEEVCMLEVEREGVSFTVDTLRELEVQYPGVDLYFLLGGDSLSHLMTWRDLPELFERVQFLFAPRSGWGADRLEPFQDALPEELRTNFRAEFLLMQEVDVSSTEVRNALAEGRMPLSVPESVLHLLRKFHQI